MYICMCIYIYIYIYTLVLIFEYVDYCNVESASAISLQAP